jgi:peptidoglycan/LPS O-acetylase OafA/YrhL
MSTIQSSDIKLAIEAGLLKRLRIIMGALGASALVYLVVALLQPPAIQVAVIHDEQTIKTFSSLLAGAAVVMLTLAWILPNKKLKNTDWAAYFEKGMPLPKGGMLTDRGQIVAQVITGYYIMRVALTEAVAIMGLTLFMYAHFVCGNLEKTSPVYYLTLAPCPVIALLIWSWIPNEEKLNELFETKLIN